MMCTSWAGAQPRLAQKPGRSVRSDTSIVCQPLGRRGVAVEPRHHQPRREAVQHRQHLVVHADRHHRRPPVEGVVAGERDLEPVHRVSPRPGRPHVTPTDRSRSPSSTPCQRAVPIRSPPISLLTQPIVMSAWCQRLRQQLVVGQRPQRLAVPRDRQRPGLGVDLRRPSGRCRSGRTSAIGVTSGEAPRERTASVRAGSAGRSPAASPGTAPSAPPTASGSCRTTPTPIAAEAASTAVAVIRLATVDAGAGQPQRAPPPPGWASDAQRPQDKGTQSARTASRTTSRRPPTWPAG